MNLDQEIIKAHKQKYEYSCIPSAIEMVLKLLRKVGIDYYDLQDEWDNKKTGNFSDLTDGPLKV